MKEIDIEEVAKKYNEIDVIWNENDKWHVRVQKVIQEFILNVFKSIENHQDLKILNAGSAGFSYNLNEGNILHIDIAKDKISHLKNSLVADIQNIPLPQNQFDLIVCVGSVINYCDPIKVFGEFNRVLKRSGYLILEFENSFTLELFGKKTFNRKATFVNSFYNGLPESVWFFSESYIKELAELHGFRMLSVKRCHIISPLIYRIFKNEKFAARFGSWDKLFCYIPFLRKFSSNSIILFYRELLC